MLSLPSPLVAQDPAGDEVAHRVLSDGAVLALVLRMPGGEADGIAPEERWSRIGGAAG